VARYDTLSDVDFEHLVADLLTEHHGYRFEAAARGPDAAIDLVAEPECGKVHVVQCKHYVNSTFAQLMSAARRERKRLVELNANPAVYTFVTSQGLTQRAKVRLHDILAPYTRGPTDVLGADELAHLLREFPAVQRSHVKLWLEHSGTLDRILNSSSYQRTRELVEEIKRSLPRYVQTADFANALDMLEETKVCIIAGPPGVGKTTLANLLLLQSIHDGYIPFEIRRDVEEAWKLYEESTKQAFLFDDFLGQTTLFESVADDMRSLRRFVATIASNPRSRLILTTREYVLHQAEERAEEFRNGAFQPQGHLLPVTSLSRIERGEILFNHVYFSQSIGPTAKRALLYEHAYRVLLDHPGYNPRMIEWLTTYCRPSPEDEAHYVAYCRRALEAPDRIWESAFERGLAPASRAMVKAFAGLPRWTSLRAVRIAFQRATELNELASDDRSFNRALRELDDSFLRSRRNLNKQVTLSLINPSLADYIRLRFTERPDEARLAMGSAVFFEQAAWLWPVLRTHSMTLPEYQVVATTLMRCVGSTALGQAALEPSFGDLRPSRLTQLRLMCEWCGDDPHLFELIAPWLSDQLAAVASESASVQICSSQTVRLVIAAAHAGLPHDQLLATIKNVLTGRDYWDSHFEHLAHLRTNLLGAFSDDEWEACVDSFKLGLRDRTVRRGDESARDEAAFLEVCLVFGHAGDVEPGGADDIYHLRDNGEERGAHHTNVAEGELEIERAHRDAEDEHLQMLFDRLRASARRHGDEGHEEAQ
jgi:conflict system STAND superfamily ATPase/restriction endonuclease